MKRLSTIIVLIFVLQAALVKGQDIHLTQFYATPLYLNPAFAGADVCSRVSLTYRNQWPGIFKTYKTYLASIDHTFQAKNIGAGLLFANDVAGSGNLQTTLVYPMISYQIKANREIVVRMGLQPGIGQRSINFNNLLFGDAIAHGTTVEQPTQTKTFFDMGAGALCFTPKYWGGLSIYHINRPDETLMGGSNGDARLPMKLSVHGGAKFKINEDEKDELHMRSVSPILHYRHQNKFDQLDIGTYYSHGYVSFGLWYRGLPLKRYKPGYSNHDAIAMIIGFKTKRANFGYSFDITISKLAGLSKGAHEVTMSYQLCKPSKRKKKKLVVPCPKF